MARLLIVDDDPVCHDILARFLAKDGHDVRSFASGREAIAACEGFAPDLLLTDWLLHDECDGIDVARALFERMPEMRIVFMTGLPPKQLENKLGDLPVIEVLRKPLDLDGLLEAVRRVLEQDRAEGGTGAD